MKKILPFLFIVFFAPPNQSYLYSQGCSDAGLCSFDFAGIDTTKTDDLEFTLRLFNTFGIGDESVLINSTGAEISTTYEGFGLLAKLPLTVTSGNLGGTVGLGDLTLLLSKRIYSTNEFNINFAGGFKIATSEADILNADDLPLPMVYQTSNGTHDLILLAYTNIETWAISAGTQIPLTRNGNTFLSSYDPVEFEEYNKYNEDYQSSFNFKRGIDVMLKVQKFFELNNDLDLMVGLLPIYRLTESKYQKNDIDVEIEDTDGTTINILAGMQYDITNKHTLGVDLGFPVVTRDVRADGLTRAFVLNVDFTFDL